jgi:clan AA aspartic protease (TIGR02281 family)
MPNMKQFQSGRMLIVTNIAGFVIGGFLIGLGAGYALWKYPEDLFLDTDMETELPTAPVQSPVAVNVPEVQPSEFEALVIRANEATGSGNYAAAIDLLMLADLSAVSAQEIEEAAYLLSEAVNRRVSQLSGAQRVAEIDALYESLTLAMPERAEFYLRLAEHRMEMGNDQGALPVLAQIENHHQWGERARELIAEITAPDPGTLLANVPLSRSGNQFIVTARLDGQREIRLLIDTGASVTIVAPQVLEGLGYNLDSRTGRFSTANGEVDAPLVGIQSLTVGEQVVSPITVGAIALPRRARPVDGLLGMNFLQKFEFSLDQQRSVLELHYRRDGGDLP